MYRVNDSEGKVSKGMHKKTRDEIQQCDSKDEKDDDTLTE